MIAKVLRSYGLTLNYLRRLVADVPEVLLTWQPGGVINHPAWVMGHLAVSAQALGGELDLPPWLPPDWEARFGTGSQPVDDRPAYPTKAVFLTALENGQLRLGEALVIIGEDGLSGPLSDRRYRDQLPTLGHAVLHILTAHAAVHVGQLSAWRRAAGLGPLQEAFV